MFSSRRPRWTSSCQPHHNSQLMAFQPPVSRVCGAPFVMQPHAGRYLKRTVLLQQRRSRQNQLLRSANPHRLMSAVSHNRRARSAQVLSKTNLEWQVLLAVALLQLLQAGRRATPPSTLQYLPPPYCAALHSLFQYIFTSEGRCSKVTRQGEPPGACCAESDPSNESVEALPFLRQNRVSTTTGAAQAS